LKTRSVKGLVIQIESQASFVIKAIASFIRLPNLILIAIFMWAFRVFLDAWTFAHHGTHSIFSADSFNWLILDVIIVTVIGYWLNDWFDQDIDRQNKPHRFLVQRPISASLFRGIILILIGASLYLTNWLAVETNHESDWWIYPVTVLLVMAYAWRFKRDKRVGNIVVSGLIMSLMYLVWLTEAPQFSQAPAVEMASFTRIIWAYAALMFMLNWGREIAKDMEDVKGDQQAGLRSIPILYGAKMAHRAIAMATVIALITEVWLASILLQTVPVALVEGSIVVVLITIAWSAFNNRENAGPISISHLFKAVMVLGVFQLALISF
jgi:4-hydroxybenzoate polyprenyltransferase